MKLIFRIILFLLLLILCSTIKSEASTLCPDSQRGLRISGPIIKKKVSGQTVVTCKYYLKRKLLGIVKAHYYNNSKKSPECGSSIFKRSKGASQSHRSFMSFVDKNLKDNYRESLWHNLGLHLLRIVEIKALPCEIDQRMIIGFSG